MIVVMKKLCIIFLVGFCSFVYAEPILGIVIGVYANNQIAFNIHGQAFTCKNYGIVTLDEITDLEKKCQQRLKIFQRRYPYNRYFSQTHLKRYQQYHLDIVGNQQCIVHVQGRKSLAELLLEAGLAVVKQPTQATITGYNYRRAARRAKRLKSGMYSDAVLRNCVHLLE